MDDIREESYCRHVAKLENEENKEISGMLAVYDAWGKAYEDDIRFYQFNTYKVMVNFVSKVMETEDLNKSASILDFCAGTGLVGEELRSAGFKGEIDAHDGSPGMLQVAKEKENVYNRTFCHVVEPDVSMPPELSRGSYDIVIACSCFMPRCVQSSCFKHLVKSVRVGGLIVFSLRRRLKEEMFNYRMEAEKQMHQLEKLSVWKLVDVSFNPQYEKRKSEDSTTFANMDYFFKKLSEYVQ